MTERRDHYSYSVYADPATARTFDQQRFGGPIGDLVARDQARVLTEFLEPLAGVSVLDVGTGTGRAALLAAEAGASVTAIDASDEMLAVARERAATRHAAVRFLNGDAHSLDFPDRSFDVVVSLRVLMHTPRWRVCLDELCRVAKDRVVVDYPSAHSLAAFQALWRRLFYTIGGSTQPYRVFLDRSIGEALRQNGFAVQSSHRQFVLPIGLYKALGSESFTRASERTFDRLGLLTLVGSPVTLLAKRCVFS